MQSGEIIGSGRDADVYALNDKWVLRRNRDGRSQRREAVVMAHLHSHGYPVPGIHPARGDDPAELIMERVVGPTLLDAVLAGDVDVVEVGAVLAELLTRLHAVPLPPREASGGGGGSSDDDGEVGAILHLDLHPLNVIRTSGGPVVIDWSNTGEGPPARDWAMSALILAEVAVADSELAPAADELLSALLARRPAAIVLDDAVMAWARAYRDADPNRPPGDLDAAAALVIARAG